MKIRKTLAALAVVGTMTAAAVSPVQASVGSKLTDMLGEFVESLDQDDIDTIVSVAADIASNEDVQKFASETWSSLSEEEQAAVSGLLSEYVIPYIADILSVNDGAVDSSAV